MEQRWINNSRNLKIENIVYQLLATLISINLQDGTLELEKVVTFAIGKIDNPIDFSA